MRPQLYREANIFILYMKFFENPTFLQKVYLLVLLLFAVTFFIPVISYPSVLGVCSIYAPYTIGSRFNT